MKKIVYLFLIIVIAVVMSACASGLGSDNSNQTGLIDQNGNIIKDTLIYTNSVRVTGNIPIWATNKKDYTIKTNAGSGGYSNYYEIQYPDGILAPNLPQNATDYYKLFVPYSESSGYHTVSYKDTNRLKQLWLNQIKRKGSSDGKVFAIRNRDNNRDMNNFQKHKDAILDYYYFKDNGDIVYKGGDKTGPYQEIVMKKFVGAVIIDFRKVTRRWNQSIPYKPDQIENSGEWTVGAIYKMAVNVNDARRRFKDEKFLDGAYDFIAVRKNIWLKDHNGIPYKTGFLRQFYSTDFMEVIVLNPYGNEGNTYCLGVDAYYAYFGDGTAGENVMPVPDFTSENYPYMTDENLYLGRRPEDIVPLLTHTTTFTDSSRNWSFLAMPGQKY